MRIVICGAGSVGQYLVERLIQERHDIVVIDTNEKILENISSDYDVQAVRGNASSLKILKKAGVSSADVFIAVTDSDETNLITCLLADSLTSNLRKIARVRELTADNANLSETIAGVFDHFSNPDFEAVSMLSRLIDLPGAVEVMEFAQRRLLVVGIMLEESSQLNGCRLRELPQRVDMSNLLVAAITRGGHLIVPRGEDRLASGDELYVVVPTKRVSSIYQLMSEPPKSIQSVIMFGYSPISRSLAKELSKKGVRVRLIEQDEELCEEAAAELTDVLVLRGDGTDQELLQNEGVADCDLFIGASDDQEENILAALLAKRLESRRAAVITTKSSYLKLVPELGIDIVVNPHIAAASSILRFVREGSVSTIVSTRDDSAEVLEVKIPVSSKLASKPLKDISLPPGVIVAAKLEDGEVIIPKGDTVLNPGERVIFFASRATLPKLQKLLK